MYVVKQLQQQPLEALCDYALYKSIFYLLTYLTAVCQGQPG